MYDYYLGAITPKLTLAQRQAQAKAAQAARVATRQTNVQTRQTAVQAKKAAVQSVAAQKKAAADQAKAAKQKQTDAQASSAINAQLTQLQQAVATLTAKRDSLKASAGMHGLGAYTFNAQAGDMSARRGSSYQAPKELKRRAVKPFKIGLTGLNDDMFDTSGGDFNYQGDVYAGSGGGLPGSYTVTPQTGGTMLPGQSCGTTPRYVYNAQGQCVYGSATQPLTYGTTPVTGINFGTSPSVSCPSGFTADAYGNCTNPATGQTVSGTQIMQQVGLDPNLLTNAIAATQNSWDFKPAPCVQNPNTAFCQRRANQCSQHPQAPHCLFYALSQEQQTNAALQGAVQQIAQYQQQITSLVQEIAQLTTQLQTAQASTQATQQQMQQQYAQDQQNQQQQQMMMQMMAMQQQGQSQGQPQAYGQPQGYGTPAGQPELTPIMDSGGGGGSDDSGLPADFVPFTGGGGGGQILAPSNSYSEPESLPGNPAEPGVPSYPAQSSQSQAEQGAVSPQFQNENEIEASAVMAEEADSDQMYGLGSIRFLG